MGKWWGLRASRAALACKFLTQSDADQGSHKATFYRHYPSQRAINGPTEFYEPLSLLLFNQVQKLDFVRDEDVVKIR